VVNLTRKGNANSCKSLVRMLFLEIRDKLQKLIQIESRFQVINKLKILF